MSYTELIADGAVGVLGSQKQAGEQGEKQSHERRLVKEIVLHGLRIAAIRHDVEGAIAVVQHQQGGENHGDHGDSEDRVLF